MELHHRLRRDPNWHPSACNICGQLGHQAANCTTGTINWKSIYGDDAFRLKIPLYESDYVRIKKEKEIDFKALEARAREYAKMKAGSLGINYEDMTKKAQEMLAAAPAVPAQKREREEDAGAAAEEPAAKVPATDATAAAVKVEEALPAGWAEAKDPQGRIYYWHTTTKKTTWTRPDSTTPS
ncbi:hypothetical protein WJX74_010394 [Apatococcus lobatus]|uniref:Uncharacterized protein n=1 Tax=Apatococcus lobatus TaxID=904363 RepID=A0AAW1RZL1_9CHLO